MRERITTIKEDGTFAAVTVDYSGYYVYTTAFAFLTIANSVLFASAYVALSGIEAAIAIGVCTALGFLLIFFGKEFIDNEIESSVSEAINKDVVVETIQEANQEIRKDIKPLGDARNYKVVYWEEDPRSLLETNTIYDHPQVFHIPTNKLKITGYECSECGERAILSEEPGHADGAIVEHSDLCHGTIEEIFSETPKYDF